MLGRRRTGASSSATRRVKRSLEAHGKPCANGCRVSEAGSDPCECDGCRTAAVWSGALEAGAAAKPTGKNGKKGSLQAERRRPRVPDHLTSLVPGATPCPDTPLGYQKVLFGGNKPHQRAGMLLSNPRRPSPRDPTEGPHVPTGCRLCLNTRRAGRLEHDRCTVNWIWPLRQKGRGLGRRGGITGGGRSCPWGLLSPGDYWWGLTDGV